MMSEQLGHSILELVRDAAVRFTRDKKFPWVAFSVYTRKYDALLEHAVAEMLAAHSHPQPAHTPKQAYLFAGAGLAKSDENEAALAAQRKAREQELTQENELLKTQLIAARREYMGARREAEHLKAENARLVDHLGELSTALSALQASLIAKSESRLCMFDCHKGIVTDIQGDEIAVTYRTAEGEIEQVYSREQFYQGKAPSLGDVLDACVLVAKNAEETAKQQAEMGQPDERDDFGAFQRKGTTGPFKI